MKDVCSKRTQKDLGQRRGSFEAHMNGLSILMIFYEGIQPLYLLTCPELAAMK